MVKKVAKKTQNFYNKKNKGNTAMGRRKYGLNQKEINKALKKYGSISVIGIFIILIAINIICFSFMIPIINPSKSNIGIIIVGVLILALGIYLIIKGKQQVIKQEKERFKEKQRLINIEKNKKKEEIRTYYNKLSILAQSNIQDTDKMTGNEFEDFLSSLFLLLGYQVKKTKLSGDFGADLIIENGIKIIVQAKRYSKSVSLSAIQEITAAKKHYQIDNAWVITNNYFTEPAKNLASDNNIRLINREELAKLILKSKNLELNQNIFEDKMQEYFQKIDNGQFVDIPKLTLPNQNNYKTIAQTFYEGNYENIFIQKLFTLKDKIILAYSNSDFEKANSLIKDAENLEIKSNDNKISMHFFYQEIASLLYTMRVISKNYINECLKYCNKDIELLKNTKMDTPVTICTLTRKAIILEKQYKLKEAIETCEFGILHNFYDDGKPFNIRKAKLEKKLGDKKDGD